MNNINEDIKILEEYLKPRLNAKTHLGYEVVRYPELEAIDNLVKGYRELKEKNNKNEQLIKVFQSEKSKCIVEHIPKSKIKEKIEEIKSRMNDDCIALHEFQRIAKIDVLQELMEEK